MTPEENSYVIYHSPGHGDLMGMYGLNDNGRPTVFIYHENNLGRAISVPYDTACVTATGVLLRDDIENYNNFDYALGAFIAWCKMSGHEYVEQNPSVRLACALAIVQAGIAHSLANMGMETISAHREKIIALCEDAMARVLDFTDTLHQLRMAREAGELLLQ